MQQFRQPQRKHINIGPASKNDGLDMFEQAEMVAA
jgi:hypothetical protein